MTDVFSVVTPGAAAAGRSILLVGEDTPIRHALAMLIEALGAVVLIRNPAELPVSVDGEVIGTVALGDDLVSSLQPDQVGAAIAGLRRWPLLMVGLGEGGVVVGGLADVSGVRLRTAPAARMSLYAFAGDEPMLWPFEAMSLREAQPRVVPLVTADDRGLRPLISTPTGHVMAQLVGAGPALYVSTVSGWPGGPPPVLWRSFCANSFLDTLPVMAFARAMLGNRGWVRPTQQACCIVDDPNLRGLRYGHLDFRAAVRLARERPFHLSVGFVPLDYRKTSAAAAQFFREHPRELSLLIHGNDHLRLELAREVPDDTAERSVRQALLRMGRHRASTGLDCPAVMTPPHGACTRPWVRALRAAGFTAAVATATHPYTQRPEEEGAGELHEMFCAELGLYGFPIILRFPIGSNRIQWLFAAWLGKPVIVYAHHGDFAGAAEKLLAAVDFINERVAPRWASIADVVHDNHQLRTSGRSAVVRVFSNDLVVGVPAGVEELVIAKQGRDIPWRSELILVDGVTVEACEHSATTLGVTVPTRNRAEVRVRFLPSGADNPAPWQRANPRSQARRMLTEARDRLAPVLLGVGGGRD